MPPRGSVENSRGKKQGHKSERWGWVRGLSGWKGWSVSERICGNEPPLAIIEGCHRKQEVVETMLEDNNEAEAKRP